MTIAVVAALLVLSLLAVPFTIELAITSRNGARVSAKLRWGTIRVGRSSRERTRRREHARRKRRGPSFRRLRALLTSPDFLASLARLGRRVLHQLRPRHLVLRFRLGLGDPADTGRAWGALTPLLLALSTLEADELRLEPDFLRRAFELEARGIVRVVPGVLLALLLGYLFTRPPWRALLRSVTA